jgi:biopolymer transport protein ExbB
LPAAAVSAIEDAPTSPGARELGVIAGELRSSRSVLGRLGLIVLSGDHADKRDASRAIEARAREEIVELESGVALLEVVITIAPLLGLLGTVSGLVNVFSNLGDTAEHSAIAIGIAEALNTTIAGLAIAVPTVVAHSYFMKKIERMGVRMEILLGGLLACVYRPAAAEAGRIADGGSARAIEEAPEPEFVPGIPRLLAGHTPTAPEGRVEYDPEDPDNRPQAT